MSRFTVFGASGFIGRHLTAHLRENGHDVVTPARGGALSDENLGHVIYAIGLTGDYRQRPYDVIEAHVGLVAAILQPARFESLLYLSSTRVYRGLSADVVANEETLLPLNPSLDGVYDYSKLLGESLCLAHSNPAVRVARLSNVYGAGMSTALFLGSVLQSLKTEGRVTIQDHADSAKDYISIDDAVAALIHVAQHGRYRLYNVASGQRTTNQALAQAIKAASLSADFSGATPTPRIFPMIDTTRLQSECAGMPRCVTDDIAQLIHLQ